jgi:hypothetical protein
VASGAFDMVAAALTLVGAAHESRSYLRRKGTVVRLMLVSGLHFLRSLIAASLATAVDALGNRLLEGVPAAYTLPPGLVLRIVPAALVGSTLFFLYRFAPARRLPPGAALVGALVGAPALGCSAAPGRLVLVDVRPIQPDRRDPGRRRCGGASPRSLSWEHVIVTPDGGGAARRRSRAGDGPGPPPCILGAFESGRDGLKWSGAAREAVLEWRSHCLASGNLPRTFVLGT